MLAAAAKDWMLSSSHVYSTMTESNIDTKRVHLGEGCLATVVCRAEDSESGVSSPSWLPKARDWPSMIEQLLTKPEDLVGYQQLKYSDKGEVFRGTLHSGERQLAVVCKRSRLSGFRGLVSRWLGWSRERRDFECAVNLIRYGISTAWPLALIDRRRPQRESWLITAYLDGAIDLDQMALAELPRMKPLEARALKDSIIKEICQQVRSLQTHGWFHRDFKASNLLLTKEEDPPNLVQSWLVDLEGVQRKRASREKLDRMLVRLAASLAQYASVTASDYVRAYHLVYGIDADSGRHWKTHYRQLAERVVEYNRRTQSRKTHKLDGY